MRFNLNRAVAPRYGIGIGRLRGRPVGNRHQRHAGDIVQKLAHGGAADEAHADHAHTDRIICGGALFQRGINKYHLGVLRR